MLLNDETKCFIKTPLLQYLNHLHSLILTMVICFAINQMIKVYAKKLTVFNTNVTLTITDTIKGLSQMKLYNKLRGFQSFKFRGGSENCLFYEMKKN